MFFQKNFILQSCLSSQLISVERKYFYMGWAGRVCGIYPDSPYCYDSRSITEFAAKIKFSFGSSLSLRILSED